MKLKNAPGRMNRRRTDALARLHAGWRKPTDEIARLELRIIESDAARGMRTKKRRALRAKAGNQ